jgi:ring-1,2-phenylacetyl-CoA epoxidase subunit PaaE
MARFHPLTVTDVTRTIRDAVVVTLRADDPAAFAFTQGQYLTFRQHIGGQELRRSYSICAGRDEGVLRVGIKRVEGGAFSSWANEALRPGDVLEAMPPMGAFHTALSPDARRHYLAFAGGSGITPVLSILKTTLAAEPHAQFTLVYANRAVSTIMFRDELEDLKNLHMGRLSVIHVLENDAQDIDLFTGRVDAEKCSLLFKHCIDPASVDTAFICGPEPMMLAISGALRDHGLTDAQIKYELFAAARPTGPRPAPPITVPASGVSAKVTLNGESRSFTMSRETSVLEAAFANSMDAPFACKAGVCSTCRAKLLEGEVEMRANHALEDYEVERGYVLTCQSHPLTDRIVLDYDQ